jgi:hypothetical protein
LSSEIAKWLQNLPLFSAISASNINAFPQLTYPHPWFGPLNAQQWLAFAAPHENIHRKQIEAIIARF